MVSLRMARRFVRGGAARLALTVLAVAWGVALIGAVRLANGAVLRAFVEVIDTMAGRAALEVVAGEGGLFPEDVDAVVRDVPGVELTVPSVRGAAFAGDGKGELLTVFGMDLASDAPERVYGVRLDVDDPLVFLARPDSIALTRSFTSARGLGIGDRIELVTPAGRRTFTVRGLLEAEGVARAYGGNVAAMDLYAAQDHFTRRGFITGIDVVVARDADVQQVASAIAQRLPAGLRVAAPAERQTDLRRVTESLRIALQALGLFGLVAAFLIMFNRLSTVFEERAWQLGVLRAVGLKTSTVWRALVGEGLVLGAAGVALGLPLGIALARLLVPLIATASAVANKLVAPPTSFAPEPGALLAAGTLGIATAALAAALPAWRAARVPVAETMGSRGCEAPGTRERMCWAFRGIALAVVAGGLVGLAGYPSAASGLIATALVAVGTALVARPAVHVAGFVVGVGARRLAGPIGRFGAVSFLHNPRRTALTVATLAVGLGCVLWFWTMAQSFRSSLVTTLTAAVRADLVVTSAHVTVGYVEAPVQDELATRLAAVPGVAAVAASRVIDWPHDGRRIAIEAIDARYFADPGFGRWPLAPQHIVDVWEHVRRGEAAIVSTSFLLTFGARVGEPVVLVTPSGPLTLVIGGATSAFESPAGTIQMSREVFVRYWRDQQVNRIGLRIAPGIDVAAVRAAIVRDLAPAYDLRILSAGELIAYYAEQVDRAFAPLGILAATVLLVTLLGVADTLLATVLARTRELGVARAIGIRRASLARTVFVEALLLGALGLALALTAGIGLAALWVRDTLPYLLGWVLEMHLPYREGPLLIVLTIAVVAAAAMLPAYRAARLEPGLALREE
jgi:putative ABC transport system permease protein